MEGNKKPHITSILIAVLSFNLMVCSCFIYHQQVQIRQIQEDQIRILEMQVRQMEAEIEFLLRLSE